MFKVLQMFIFANKLLLKHYTMKQFLLLTVFVLQGYFMAAQDCPPSLLFENQEQIDSFSINYPNCTELPWDLVIEDDPSINSLEGLSQITSIGGRLEINYNPSLMSLEGLNNLTSVGSRVDIRRASEGATLEGLDNLTSIGGRLLIEHSRFLTLNGLESLTSIGGSLLLLNTSFTNLAALNNLTFVGGG